MFPRGETSIMKKSILGLASAAIVAAITCVAVVACEDETVMGKEAKVNCSHGKVDCGGTCVDLVSNPDHCGACGLACSSTLVCSRGSCQANCNAGLLNCDRSCVNTHANNDNCGACGNACVDGNVCASSECKLSCPLGQTECGNGCVFLDHDASNCGKCGDRCLAGEVCQYGKCATSCEGRTNCGGSCVNTDTDPQFCGGCDDHGCSVGEACDDGRCGSSCGGSRQVCYGSCVAIETDLQYCGGCDVDPCGVGENCVDKKCVRVCPTGQLFCKDVDDCVDIKHDPEHCGGCGPEFKCGDSELCNGDKGCVAICDEGETREIDNGTLVCEGGILKTVCKEKFFDCDGEIDNGCEQQHDPRHGTVSKPYGACVIDCEPGFDDCNHRFDDGCETPTDSDDENCGACGRSCGAYGAKPSFCLAGYCWEEPWKTEECTADGLGTIVAIQTCPYESFGLVSECCKQYFSCDEADMIWRLACKSNVPGMCFSYIGWDCEDYSLVDWITTDCMEEDHVWQCEGGG